VVAALAVGVAQALTLPGVCPIRSAAAQVAPADPEAAEFSVVLLPDTQFYALRYPRTFLAQTRWIAAEQDDLNIEAVIHLGDITHRNTRREWRVADRAMRVLDGVVPYTVLPGNHDGLSHGRDATQGFNRTFPPSRFRNRPWYGGHMTTRSNNSYILFEAAGMELMVVSLAYGTPPEALEWANAVVEEHPRRRVIVATHAYMDCDHTRLVRGDHSAVESEAWTDGDQIWNAFVKRHPNIFLVVSGHITGGGHATVEGDHGNSVYELLADFQGLRAGGSGYLTILTFRPAANAIRVRTYSPTLERELPGSDYAFDLPYEMLIPGNHGLVSAKERTDD